MNKFKFIIFIFIHIFLPLIHCSNYISMKLYNYNNELMEKIPDNSFSYEDFINATVNNLLYTSIKIGNPYQEVKTWVNADEFSYFIFKDICILDSYYNEYSSSTFESNDKNSFYYNGYGETVYINETFILKNNINNINEIEVKKFPVMFMKDPKNDKIYNDMHTNDTITNKTCATIGFSYMANYNDKNSKNFLFTLKEKNVIDDYTIFIEYDKNGNEQYLILGGYPEEIFNKKYNIKYQNFTYIKFYYEFINQWGLNFDKIYSGENYIFYQMDAAFHYELGVIYGAEKYQLYIESNFFNYYVNLKICEIKEYNDYTFFMCNKDKFTIEEMKKFPELKFFKAELYENLTLTYEDLFYTKGNNVYFLIVFKRMFKKVWELGKPFLKKYSFAFNFDSKLILYYKKLDDSNDDNKKSNKSFLKENIIFIIIIVILSIILGIVSFLLGRYLYNKKKKKIKAEEMDQDFNYENYENNENNEINENNKKDNIN